MGSGEFGPDVDFEAAPELTEAQQKKLRLWRRMIIGCLAGAGVALAAEIALLAWPGASRGLRLTVGGIFLELSISAAVLGAAGRCPACNAGFDACRNASFRSAAGSVAWGSFLPSVSSLSAPVV